MKPNVIVINPQDNVAVALEDIPEGGAVTLPGGDECTALERIPYSHKVALRILSQAWQYINTVRRSGMPWEISKKAHGSTPTISPSMG